jgi:uncharacterized protein
MHVLTTTREAGRCRTLPLGNIALTDGFWAHKQAVNREVSLRRGYRQLEEAGNFHNLRLAAGTAEGEYRSPQYMDSDIYKWLEALAYDLTEVTDSAIRQMVEEVTDLIIAAQAEDGYLNSYYQVVEPDNRWGDLDHGHELYCAGHFFEAAVAVHRATGDERLFKAALRFADYIDTVFGQGKRAGAPGHPEIELALVELYRETGERRYLDLAAFFVDQRGSGRMRGYHQVGPEYHQDHVPVREAHAVAGHAVRQLYLAAGVTDLYLETGEEALLKAMERLWHDVTRRKMHITAGLGARFTGESFGEPYELSSDRCYCETCAAIANIMWNWRMLLATGEARFADLLERSLYNGFLSGVSLDGNRFFYVNPLQSRGGVERQEWYGCACCPPNVMRLLAMVGSYAATVSDDGVQVHQFMSSLINTSGARGPDVKLRMDTGYPWTGDVTLMVAEASGGEWGLSLRIPGWCQTAQVLVNGVLDQEVRAVSGEEGPGHYVTLRRAWRPGDEIRLSLGVAPRLTESNPRVDAVRGTACVERGPLVYCLEQVDQVAGLDLLDVRVPRDADMASQWRGDLLDGIVTVEVPGTVVEQGPWKDRLYLSAADRTLSAEVTSLTAVPYYAWANRGPGVMRVWIPLEGN